MSEKKHDEVRPPKPVQPNPVRPNAVIDKKSSVKRPAATAQTPARQVSKSSGGSSSWLAGFIKRAASGIAYAAIFILCRFWQHPDGCLRRGHERSMLL